MKIRTGFVSNSSSSSFCIYGMAVNSREQVMETYRELFKGKEDEEMDEDDGMYEICEAITDEIPMTYYVDSDSDIYYFGRSYSSGGDSETFGDFKKSIDADMKKAFGDSASCSHIEEEIYG